MSGEHDTTGAQREKSLFSQRNCEFDSQLHRWTIIVTVLRWSANINRRALPSKYA